MIKFEHQYQHLYIPSSYFFVLLELSAAECEEPDIPMPYEKAKYFEKMGIEVKYGILVPKMSTETF